MIFKGDMKKSTWLNSYENWNVDIGLRWLFWKGSNWKRNVGNARSDG